jgi:glycolate dehydrogenase FAD-binding subunit
MADPADLMAAGHQLDTRAADPARDRVDDLLPGLVVLPGDAAAVAFALEWAARKRLSVVIRGQGSKLGWGARSGPIDLLLDMSRLDRIIDYQPGDLTVTAEAGIRLQELNRHLASHGQWLALDPPFADRATIGGLIATNDSGPHRHRFGTPRDLVIGIQLATTDGQLAKAGGRVVKNVAGYDLSKIVSGSFGTLAAIVSATFKLAPLPGASATVIVERLSIDRLFDVTAAMSASQLEPVAFDVHLSHPAGAAAPEITCLIRFASFREVVDAEVANASVRMAGVHQDCRTLEDGAERDRWTAHVRKPWDAPGTVIRLAWRPSDLRRAIRELVRIAGATGFELVGRLGVGAGCVRLEGDVEDQRQAVSQLQESDAVANVVVARAPLPLRTAAFVWGPRPALRILQALKGELDPAGILGAGRGPS